MLTMCSVIHISSGQLSPGQFSKLRSSQRPERQKNKKKISRNYMRIHSNGSSNMEYEICGTFSQLVSQSFNTMLSYLHRNSA